MPRSLFLFSGETGDCCPESTPDDRGDWSERTHSSSFSGRPAGQKHKNAIIDTPLRQSKEEKSGIQNKAGRVNILWLGMDHTHTVNANCMFAQR